VIADRRFIKLSPVFRSYARKKPSWLVQAQTPAELAARIGLPPGALTLEVAERVLIEGAGPMAAALRWWVG